MNNLSHIEYFIAAVQSGNFSSAARDQYVTPQTISKAVSEMERELGLQLFVREGRVARPTPYARLIASLMSEGVASLKDAEAVARVHPLRPPRESALSLLVASAPYRGCALGADDIDGFGRLCPDIELAVAYDTPATCIKALEQRRCDVVAFPGRAAACGCTCLKATMRPVCLAVARTNVLADRRSLRLEDLRGVPIARPVGSVHAHGLLESALCECGIAPIIVTVPPTAESNRRFFERLGGAAFVIDDPAIERQMPFVVRRPIRAHRRIAQPICLVYPKERANPAIACLAHYLMTRNALALRAKALPPPLVGSSDPGK